MEKIRFDFKQEVVYPIDKMKLNIISTPSSSFENPPSVLEEFIKQQSERQAKAIDDFIKKQLGFFIKLPDFILKRLYSLKRVKYSFNIKGGVIVYEFKNKLTGKIGTLLFESVIDINIK